MIKGINKTKEEGLYRAIEKDSSSSLKDFSMDRRKYYKKYYLREDVVEKDNLATNMGRLVETLLLEPEEFDNRFYMSSCVTVPTGLMLEFVEALYRATAAATDGFGVITRTFEDITDDAYAASGFKIAKAAVLGKFMDSSNEIYYREIREVRSKKLTVVTAQDVTNAERIVEELQNNEFTKDIINRVSDDRYTVMNQFQIDGYFVDGHEFKSMIDKVIIDHKDKKIHIYDLKCVWSVENFYGDYYLYRRAYIQGYLYWRALCWVAMNDESYPWKDYIVEFPQFIVCDSINYYSPLIYKMSSTDLIDAYEGFTWNDKIYPGVKPLIEELKWAQVMDVWNISKTNYENQGFVNIRPNGHQENSD
jgi:hypothetical protein